MSQQDIVFKLSDLNTIVANTLNDFYQIIEQKNIQFKIDKLPSIICEDNHIRLVFHHLISNAIKFNNSKKPLIIISCKDNSETFWEFSIKDNGIGIPRIYQNKIFDIFKRLHNKQDYDGTGIGLTLCEKIIQRHGGKIWVESQDGLGTIFYFTISKNLNKRQVKVLP